MVTSVRRTAPHCKRLSDTEVASDAVPAMLQSQTHVGKIISLAQFSGQSTLGFNVSKPMFARPACQMRFMVGGGCLNVQAS